MAVPTTGSFLMFGTGSNTTIAGAIIEGGASSETVASTLNFNALKALADINKFDAEFKEGASTLEQIVKSTQFKGYPISGSTTTTTLAPEGICRFIWASSSVDVERYGLRYNLPNTPSFTFTEFAGLPNEVFTLNGNSGFAYSVCSVTTPQVWDFFTEEIVDLGSDIVSLYNGGACSLNNQCDFVPPTSTTTTTTTTSSPTTTTTTTTTLAPTFCQKTLYFDVSVSPGPTGWNSSTDACNGTGTPLTVYFQPRSIDNVCNPDVYDEYLDGHIIYLDSALTQPLVGDNTWYKTTQTPNSGFVVKVDDNGFMDQIATCVATTTTTTTTAAPTTTTTTAALTTTTTTTTPTTTTTAAPTTTTTAAPTIFTHGAVRAVCSDYCTTNYNITTSTFADANYDSLTIGDTIYGQGGVAGFVAYSNVSTDTTTGPFRIAEIDSSGVVVSIKVCVGGSCEVL